MTASTNPLVAFGAGKVILLGEHSVQVLAEAGYSRGQIHEMVQAGVTQATPAASDREVTA